MHVKTQGEAAIIGTIILIVVVIVSGGIVAYYTLGQTRSADASCLEALQGIEFNDVGFNCRMLTASGGPLSSFSVKLSDDRIEGFQLGIPQGGTTDTYEIRTGRLYSNVCLLDSQFNAVLAIPALSNTLTYVVRGDVPHLFVAPILKGGKGCYAEARKDLAIPNECVNPEVKTRLAACLGGTEGPRCGDGVVNQPSEQCEGMTSRPCTATGDYVGTEVCNPTLCVFNACTTTLFCGDGRVDGTEECDDGNTDNEDSCDTSCHTVVPPQSRLTGVSWLDTSVVEGDPARYHIEGENVRNRQVAITIWEDDVVGDELMTPTPIIATFDIAGSPIEGTWTSVWQNDAYSDPEYYIRVQLVGDSNSLESSWLNELTVTQRNAECGNGFVQQGEQCDPTSTCNLGYGAPDGSYCNNACQTATCHAPRCGDAIIQNPFGEVCDGLQVGGRTCTNEGFDTGGPVGCSPDCRSYDVSLCRNYICGNNQREGTEVCDGSDVAGQSCTSMGQGFTGGTLQCASGCGGFDTSQCTTNLCGNGQIDPGETCEPPGSTQSCFVGGSSGVTGGVVTGRAGSTGGGPGSGGPGGTSGMQRCESNCQWGVCA